MDDSSSTSEMRTEITDSEPESQGTKKTGEQKSDDDGLAEQLDALGLDKKFLVDECGCHDREVLINDNKLDQFLVLKSILDKNMPKLRHLDIQILQNILLDIFPDIAAP